MRFPVPARRAALRGVLQSDGVYSCCAPNQLGRLCEERCAAGMERSSTGRCERCDGTDIRRIATVAAFYVLLAHYFVWKSTSYRRANYAMQKAGSFGVLDWLVVLALLAGTTLLGHRMSGRQESVRDFFLGGRRLPWYAVAASVVATEISAVTFVSLPSVVWGAGGNLTYLQVGLVASLIARFVVGYLLVPAYYRREILSPYDYVGEQLGTGARRIATGLFTVAGVLGQAARVYMTALLLEVLLAPELAHFEALTGSPPLWTAVGAITVVAVLWTWMGGIAAVVWTDAVLFLLFLVGAAILLCSAAAHVDGGFAGVIEAGERAGKLQLLDLSTDPRARYTLWTALFLLPFDNVFNYGTNQLLVQRLLCCRGEREARRAIIASYVSVVVIALVALVGVGLFAYTETQALSAGAMQLVAEKADRILPVFVVEVVPTGLKGLVLAGAFAAAISSLDSILAALSQTSLSLLPAGWRSPERAVRSSRGLVFVWGVVLAAVAVSIEPLAVKYGSVLDMALAVAGYTGGALLGTLLLALLGRRDGSGLSWSAPLSVAVVSGSFDRGPQKGYIGRI